ncbi:hypothetical protein JI667_06900 [Bacillus sp. NTK074B]|uniref:DUF418 domain-containing protein n=1 Tax=Bacillus sp. NTK074B TaxID=2802174 RepID=UPI001A8C2576|nr:hypothetical protein [Bacillus sp. NTK074B]
MNQKIMKTTIPDKNRITILDSLRGFALLGIFLINITSIGSAGGPPTFETKHYLLDELYNQFLLLMIESKFFTLFSFLFGVGFAIQLTRANEQGIDIVPRFSRRLICLFLFGAIHIALFWEGDILVIYSVAGAALLLFRKCQNKTLLIWIASFLIIPIVGVTGTAITVDEWLLLITSYNQQFAPIFFTTTV